MIDKGLENAKYYGILKILMSLKVNRIIRNLVYVVHIPSLVNCVNFVKIGQVV